MKLKIMNKWFGGTLIAEQLSGVTRLAVAVSAVTVVVLLGGAGVATFAGRQLAALSSYDLGTVSFSADLLQLRRNEKDFFDRKNADELAKHAGNATTARERVAALRAGDQPTAEERQTLEGLQHNLEGYLAAFKKAADSRKALGLNENAGLEGTLRSAVHDIEKTVRDAGAIELTASMLQMRRHEKDFILRERQEYADAHAAEMQRFKGLVSGARFDAATRAELLRLSEAYDTAFHGYVAGSFAMDKDLGAARELAHNAEAPVPMLLKGVAERRESAARRSLWVNIGIGLFAIISLLGAALALRRSLKKTADSIEGGVGALQSAVDRVRSGEELAQGDGVQTKDEIGAVWRTVHGLLTERREAQLKAEAENDRLNNSVIHVLQAVHQLSQRDLTARAPVTQDVIGTVSDSINALTDETTKVLMGVNKIAGQVAEVSGNVRSQAALVSETALAERANVSQMVDKLADATLTMNQVATLAQQCNVSATQATQVTDTALETVNATVKGMELIRETIAETEKRIKRLGERSQEISGIVNLINTISERTHVLALNASMQAAVAGEAGRGFAVVAEEVQRLAESSRNATQQIGTLVNNIQLETNETISTVNRTIGQVVQGSEQAQRSGEQMRHTQQITNQLVAQVKRIADASEQQKEMAANLLGSVQQIGQSTERTAEQITAQNVETESLMQSARRLVESVNVFKLPQPA